MLNEAMGFFGADGRSLSLSWNVSALQYSTVPAGFFCLACTVCYLTLLSRGM